MDDHAQRLRRPRDEYGGAASGDDSMDGEVAESPGAARRESEKQISFTGYALRTLYAINFQLSGSIIWGVVNWAFLSNHGRALVCIARDPQTRLRDVAADLGITERRAHGIVRDLVESGYITKTKDGRRNRYQVRAHLPLPEPTASQRSVGEVLALLAGTDQGPA